MESVAVLRVRTDREKNNGDFLIDEYWYTVAFYQDCKRATSSFLF